MGFTRNLWANFIGGAAAVIIANVVYWNILDYANQEQEGTMKEYVVEQRTEASHIVGPKVRTIKAESYDVGPEGVYFFDENGDVTAWFKELESIQEVKTAMEGN